MSVGESDHRDLGGRLPTAVAGTIAVVGVGLVALSLLIWASQGFPRLPQSFSRTPVAIIPSQLLAVACIVVGALLGHRVPRNPVGWLYLVAGCAMVLILPVALIVAQAHQAFRPAADPVRQAAWVVSSLPTPIVLACVTLVGLCFPDGRLPTRWQRAAAVLVIAAAIAFGAATAFDPSGLVWYPSIANPFAAPSGLEPAFAIMRLASAVFLLVAVVGAMASVALRYRAGDEVTRAQLRWIVFGAAIFVLAVVPFILTRYLVPTSDAASEVVAALANLGGVAIAVTTAFAITRYRLFGIDRLISRALVYVPLMGVLAGLYALVVALSQRMFTAVTGEASDAALLIAVFLIAAAFTPLRQALERAVDRWARPALAPTAPPSATSSPTEDEALWQTAARLIALQRLEERLVRGESSDRPGHRLDVDSSGRVPCPLGTPASVTGCLACPHLVALTVSTPGIVCARAT